MVSAEAGDLFMQQVCIRHLGAWLGLSEAPQRVWKEEFSSGTRCPDGSSTVTQGSAVP